MRTINSGYIKKDGRLMSTHRILYSSDNSSISKTDDGNERKLEKPKRNQLSPTSRIQNLLFEEKGEEPQLRKNASGAGETLPLHRRTENTEKIFEHDEHINYSNDNPVGYNPTNPRSATNLSYLDLPSYTSNLKQSDLSGSRRKSFRTLSVADRITSLQAEGSEEKHDSTKGRDENNDM